MSKISPESYCQQRGAMHVQRHALEALLCAEAAQVITLTLFLPWHDQTFPFPGRDLSSRVSQGPAGVGSLVPWQFYKRRAPALPAPKLSSSGLLRGR